MREIKFRVFIKWLKIILEVESIDFIKKRVYCKTGIKKQNPCDFYNLFADKENLRWGLLSRLFDADMQDILKECEVIGNIYENKDLLES